MTMLLPAQVAHLASVTYRPLKAPLLKPRATFDGNELYPDIVAKAATLGFLLAANHPFVDGNKRVGHAAMEVFLVLNGYEIEADIEEQEHIILSIASGQLNRPDFEQWLRQHTKMVRQHDASGGHTAFD